MRTLAHPSLFAVALLSVSACGVPQGKYDAALNDAHKAKSQLHDLEKANQDLKGRVTAAEGKAGTVDEATRLELEELRKQKAAADARLKLFEDFLGKFKKMIDAGRLDISIRHGHIVLALGTDILFDTGKTEVKPEGQKALAEVADTLKGVSGRRFQISGHTDTIPIKTKEFPSNWELSAARAVAVVKLLTENHVKPVVLSAAAYAEYDPSSSNGSEKGRAKNRRIEITIVPNIEDLVKMPEIKR